MAVSMDHRWFAYSDAERLLDLAVHGGLLRRDGDQVTATFDVTTVDLPVNFRPTEDVLRPANDENLLQTLVDEVRRVGGIDAKTAMARVNRKQEAQLVDLETAALLVLLELGGDARAYAGRVQALTASRR
jgi:hypothetical protein